jgi:intermediate filament protein if
MEELEFLRRVHDQEVNELQALINMQPADTKSFFQNEIALAIRDIRDEYDNIALQVKADTESWYRLKVGYRYTFRDTPPMLQVSEVAAASTRSGIEGGSFSRDEVTRVRTNIEDVRAKLAALEAKNKQLENTVRELTKHLTDDQRMYEVGRCNLIKMIHKYYNRYPSTIVTVPCGRHATNVRYSSANCKDC